MAERLQGQKTVAEFLLALAGEAAFGLPGEGESTGNGPLIRPGGFVEDMSIGGVTRIEVATAATGSKVSTTATSTAASRRWA
jgi:hypothetical protein